MKDEPLVVAVVTNWNGTLIDYKGKSITKLCLDSLLKTNYKNLKVIFADEGSVDDSVKYFSKLYKNIEITTIPKNRGWCAGANRAFEYAFKKYPNLDYIASLNNDLIFNDKDWLKKLVAAAKKDPDIGVVGCRLWYPDGRIQHGGAKLTLFGIKFEKDKKASSVSRYLPLVTGAVIIVKRDALLKAGLVDETYLPFNWEDMDWETRMVNEGFKIYYVGNTDIIHLEGFSVRSKSLKLDWTSEEIARFTRRNGYIYYFRHAPLLSPIYFIADFFSNFIAFDPSVHIRDGKTIRIRLSTQLPALSDALKVYKTYKIKKKLL